MACAIEKLPPAWKDFKNYLKHKRKEMTMEDLEVRLRIEEDNRGSEKKAWINGVSAKANMMEHGQGSKNKKGKYQGSKLGPKGGISKKPRFEGKCYNCDKTGHKSVDCNKPRRNKKKEANLIEAVTQEVADMNLCCMISDDSMEKVSDYDWGLNDLELWYDQAKFLD